MKDFYYYLKRGELRIPRCTNCRHKVWPPAHFCNNCFHHHLELIKVKANGRILEFAKSQLNEARDRKLFALIEIDGIKIVGSVAGSDIRNNGRVVLEQCGCNDNNDVFYEFRAIEDVDEESG